ncbi:MAG: efflux transporter outer membrane subunit [Proteobacteria bacterium]|nr:efflux transporter outer membrane subunit [Pseudomonadota bacterium]
MKLAISVKYCTSLCLAAWLAGCAAPVQVKLDGTVPEHWTQAAPAPGAASVDMRAWWRPWGDARLDALVDEALAHNLDVAQAVTRLRQQRLLAGTAGAAYRPIFSAGARTLQDIAAIDSYFHASLDMVWDLGLFGAAEAGERAAGAQLLDAGARLQAARVALVADVVHRYLDLRLAQRQHALLADMALLDARALRLARVRLDQHLGTQAELQQWQAQAQARAAAAAQLRETQARAAHGLALLLGRTRPDPAWLQDDAGAALPEPAALAPAELPADLLRTRPDIRRAEAQVEQAAADLGLARSALYPRFQLAGSLLYSYNLTQNTRTRMDRMPLLGPQIDIPLFDWGRRRAQADASEQALQGAILGYRQSVLEGLAEVEGALAALAAQGEREQALSAAREQALGQAQALERRQRLGLASEWSALPGQRALLQAQGEIATARAARALAYVALYKALGGAPLVPVDDPVARAGGAP